MRVQLRYRQSQLLHLQPLNRTVDGALRGGALHGGGGCDAAGALHLALRACELRRERSAAVPQLLQRRLLVRPHHQAAARKARQRAPERKRAAARARGSGASPGPLRSAAGASNSMGAARGGKIAESGERAPSGRSCAAPANGSHGLRSTPAAHRDHARQVVILLTASSPAGWRRSAPLSPNAGDPRCRRAATATAAIPSPAVLLTRADGCLRGLHEHLGRSHHLRS